MEISLLIPEKIGEKLREMCRRTGSPEEELIVEALSEFLGESVDPESRVELHLALSNKYMRGAEELLKKENYVQASEKAWGAASQIVKAVAAKRGRELRSRGELHKFVTDLSGERRDREILTLWFTATTLHQNSYENWLPPSAVENAVENVRKFIEEMREELNAQK